MREISPGKPIIYYILLKCFKWWCGESNEKEPGWNVFRLWITNLFKNNWNNWTFACSNFPVNTCTLHKIHALLFIYNVIRIISIFFSFAELKSNFSFQHNEIFAEWSTHAVQLDGFTFPNESAHLWKYFQTIDHFFLPYKQNDIVFFSIVNEMKIWKKTGIIYVFASLNEESKKKNNYFFLQNRSNGTRNMRSKMGQKQWDEKRVQMQIDTKMKFTECCV